MECETELEKRGAAPHVSSVQETWRPGITQTHHRKPLSLCIVSKLAALQISADETDETQALGLFMSSRRTTEGSADDCTISTGLLRIPGEQ